MQNSYYSKTGKGTSQIIMKITKKGCKIGMKLLQKSFRRRKRQKESTEETDTKKCL